VQQKPAGCFEVVYYLGLLILLLAILAIVIVINMVL
jgi:hypothetical protein